MERAKAFILVTILTALIWVFAESESVRVETVYVDLVAASGPAAVRVIRSPEGRPFTLGVEIEVRGSTVKLSALRQSLPKTVEIEPGAEGVPTQPGPHALDLRTVLRSHPAFREQGVNLEKVQPSTASVLIDEMVTRECKVVVAAPEGALEGPAEPSPATVKIRLPSTIANALPASPEAVARITADMLSTLTEGRRASISNVALTLPEGLPVGGGSAFVRMEPAQVDIALTVRSKTASIVIPSVPVQLRISPVEYAAWDITVAADDRVLKNVTVTGPADLVGRIERGELKIVATVAVAFDEFERARKGPVEIAKDAFFSDLPAPLRFDVEDRSIKLLIAPRLGADGGDGDAGPPPSRPGN